ncbi:hypothetical protein FB45DRAFT_335932 [Roridomyces roridus]|uniref:Uncharacterized protein n=1 Tax=Roridomyces roridus TaxID=1738132 RepID=A0AAD7B402_9AGAR|nr:hypothetical protein FB45DRAFT_335932 [Roridomyces roridus]
MAISLPLVDSSNSTRAFTTSKRPLHVHAPHSHLLGSSPRKSPPTCTLSLASAGLDDPSSILSDFPASCVPFPHVELAGDSPSCAEDRSDRTTPIPRRPRARTSHVVTPKRPSSSGITKPVFIPKPSSTRSVKPKQAQGSPADTRFAALLERSISARLALATVTVEGLDMQDALLASRLRASLARLGLRTRTPSPPPRVLTTPVRPPSIGVSLLFSGSTTAECTSLSSSPYPSPLPLRVAFAVTSRARSGSASSSSGSVTNKDTASMDTLVASLMLRRHEGSLTTKRSSNSNQQLPAQVAHRNQSTACLSGTSRSSWPRTRSPLAGVQP